MKKLALFAVLQLILAGSAFAATDGAYGTPDDAGNLVVGGTNGSANVKLSKNVSLYYESADLGLGYSVAAFHSSGTKTFASSSGDSKIWFQDVTNVDAPGAPSGTDSADFTGWTAL